MPTLQVDVTLAVKELKGILPDICKYFEATESAFRSYCTLYLLSCPEDPLVGLTFHQVKTSGQILSSHLMPCEVERLHKDIFLKVPPPSNIQHILHTFIHATLYAKGQTLLYVYVPSICPRK